MAKSTTFDRRGFESQLRFWMLMIPVSFILMIFYSWKVGLALGLWSCMWAVMVEAVSARPKNNPTTFTTWARKRDHRRPVLLCLGDSLTHATCGASITSEIPMKLCAALGLPTPADYGKTFVDPIWVVNAGQNGITTHTILHERLNTALNVYPDFIMILIGTNDVSAIYKRSWCKRVMQVNDLPEVPSMHVLERNLTGIINFIREASPKVEIGLCTLPPMGEDLKSESNKLVRQANVIIERVAVAAGEKITVIPIFAQLESVLEKHRQRWTLPVDYWQLATILQALVYYLKLVSNWNLLSKPFGFYVMSDGLHLNERGRDLVVDLVVDWLKRKNVAKAIAVKS